MATGTFLGDSQSGASRAITGPPASTRQTIPQGWNPGIVSWDRYVLATDGKMLWKSTNRGLAFTDEPLPDTIADGAGNRIGLGRSAQGLAVLAVGTGAVDPPAGVTSGGALTAATVYYVLESVDDAGALTWSAARTSTVPVGTNYLTQLPWANRLTGGNDPVFGIQIASDYVTSGTDRITNLNTEWTGAGLTTVQGPSWDQSNMTDTLADAEEFLLGADWTVEIEHSGNNGTVPLEDQWRVWYCGPRVRQTAKPARGAEVQVGRFNPHTGLSVGRDTRWTNAVGPCSGIWTGNRFIVVQGTPTTSGVVFIAREYTTPSSYQSLQVSPTLPRFTAEPIAIRTYLTSDGFGLVVLSSTTLSTRQVPNTPELSYTRWRRGTNRWDDWETLSQFTGAPAWTSTYNTSGMLNVDRYPPDSAVRAVVGTQEGQVWYYQDLTPGVPVATWTGTSGQGSDATAALPLTWTYTHVDSRVQKDWQITRHINDPLTGAALPVDWWSNTNLRWETTEVWNAGTDLTVTVPAGWAGAGSNSIYSSVRFDLKVRDSLDVESDTVSFAVEPFIRPGQFTITSPPVGSTVSGFVTVTAQFPIDPADRPFEPSLFTDGTVFAAEYILQVHERGKANLVSSDWRTAIFPAGSTGPFTVSHTFQQIPNGTGWIARAQWRQYGYPRNTSDARFNSFIIQLAPPTLPSLTVRGISDDDPQLILAATAGLVRGAVALRITVTGTIGPLPGAVTLERREISRTDHRPLTSDRPTFVLPTPYITGQTYDDYTVLDGVEYQYRAKAVNNSGAAIIGAWTPA